MLYLLIAHYSIDCTSHFTTIVRMLFYVCLWSLCRCWCVLSHAKDNFLSWQIIKFFWFWFWSTRGHLGYKLLVSRINKRTPGPGLQTAGLPHQQKVETVGLLSARGFSLFGEQCKTAVSLLITVVTCYLKSPPPLTSHSCLQISAKGFAVKANPTHNFGTHHCGHTHNSRYSPSYKRL